MTETADAKHGTDPRSSYFYLSYARSDPLAVPPRAKPDALVERFFTDLTKAVKRHASRRPDQVGGFFDRQIPLASDWKKSLRSALGDAQVFVALYSVRYVDTSYPGREWACFHKGVERTGTPDPNRRIVPVLWAPLDAEPEDLPGLDEALSLGADDPAYTENGLRALMNIKSYRPSYRTVLNVLAKRIVALAEKSPIESSEVPDIDKMKSAFAPRSPLAVFSIETAALTANAEVKGHSLTPYGASSILWRPFPGQQLPLAEYARQVAVRFDFDTKIGDIAPISSPQARKPGIILIDPWLLATKDGRPAFASAIEDLPRWVLPLVILDRPDDRREQALVQQVREMLGKAGALLTNSARRGAQGVSSLDDFVSLMPKLVAEAERQYLRKDKWPDSGQAPGKVPSLKTSRPPHLRDAVQAAEATSGRRRPGEEKDV